MDQEHDDLNETGDDLDEVKKNPGDEDEEYDEDEDDYGDEDEE